jgi:peptidyl-prolyl cis-trans isomerase SurA
LRQRVALFVATSGLHPTADDMKRIHSQTLDALEDEKIRLQEAVKEHITVSPVEVDKAINNLMDQNHITIDQLRAVLANAGSSEATLRSQITAQLAWQKTVQDKYSDLVNVSQAQVDAEVQRYADGANKPHFLVNEIFLPVTKPELDAKVLQDAQGMESQLQSGAQFGAMAHQYSQNPAAAQGGSIGWVHEGQLPTELNDALVKMTQGQISPPVRAAGGYYVLQLAARQEPVGTKIADPATASTNPDGTLPLARLLLPLGPSPTQEIVNSGMNAGNEIRKGFASCDQLKSIASKMNGSVYMDLGNMKPSDLSPDIQKALSQTQPGEATAPILSDAGVEIIARCDKRVEVQTAFQMPSREQVEEELFNLQISALAARYMRDLKRDADVEVR